MSGEGKNAAGTQAFVSIGQNCSAASWLQGVQARTQSLIFDWGRSSLPSVRDVLLHGHAWHLGLLAQGAKHVDYPHHTVGMLEYAGRCSQRFFATVKAADDLTLIHCAPAPVDSRSLLAVEAALLPRREDFRIVALYGYARRSEAAGIVGQLRISDRTMVYTVAADKEFETNRMHGKFYADLFNEVFPWLDRARLYRCDAVVEDADPA